MALAQHDEVKSLEGSRDGDTHVVVALHGAAMPRAVEVSRAQDGLMQMRADRPTRPVSAGWPADGRKNNAPRPLALTLALCSGHLPRFADASRYSRGVERDDAMPI